MSRQIWGHGGHLCFPIGQKNTNLVNDVKYMCFLSEFVKLCSMSQSIRWQGSHLCFPIDPKKKCWRTLSMRSFVFSAPEPKAQVHYCDHVLSVRRPSVVRLSSLTFHIFDFSETAKLNSTKLDRKQDLNVLYKVCVFWADRKNKMAALASDWLRHFRLLLWNRWTEFNETWQEARSQCPL